MTSRFCQQCGAALDPAQRFCERCGAAIGSAPAISPAPPEPVAGPPAQPRPLGAIALLICSVTLSGLYAWHELSRPTERMASAPAPAGRCVSVKVEEVSSRFGAEPGQFGSEDGIVTLSNGVGLYLYRSLKRDRAPGWGISETSRPINLTESRLLFSPGDPVTLCLQYLPPSCPPGDERGRIYTMVNPRTGARVDGHYGRNGCGGA